MKLGAISSNVGCDSQGGDRETSHVSPDQALERIKDSNYLPTHHDFDHAFGTGGRTYGNRLRWFTFCYDQDRPTFEFVNAEFVEELGNYLTTRAIEIGASKDKPLFVLEIGAGDGRLAHFMSQHPALKASGLMKIIATDSGDRGLNAIFPVEELTHREALEKYQPDIVIFSWMPYEYACTEDIRSCPSIQEYLLIGDKSCCGDMWLTWGNSYDSRPSRDDYEDENGDFDEGGFYNALREHENSHKTPPFERDGFEMMRLGSDSKTQICRSDFPGSLGHSSTVSFKRTSSKVSR